MPQDNHHNMKVLRRLDKDIHNIGFTATHVTVYKFSTEANKWERAEIEGTLFVVDRKALPTHRFVIMNRLGPNNLVEDLGAAFEFEQNDEFFLYKNVQNEVRGLWFYEDQERQSFSKFIKDLIASLSANMALGPSTPPAPAVAPTVFTPQNNAPTVFATQSNPPTVFSPQNNAPMVFTPQNNAPMVFTPQSNARTVFAPQHSAPAPNVFSSSEFFHQAASPYRSMPQPAAPLAQKPWLLAVERKLEKVLANVCRENTQAQLSSSSELLTPAELVALHSRKYRGLTDKQLRDAIVQLALDDEFVHEVATLLHSAE